MLKSGTYGYGMGIVYYKCIIGCIGVAYCSILTLSLISYIDYSINEVLSSELAGLITVDGYYCLG
jgi:hypothetical protein